MDIQISSNFERLLFDLYDRDGKAIAEMMGRFRQEKKLTLSPLALSKLRAEFAAASVDDEETKATIASCYKATGELLDPHTAVGLAAGAKMRRDLESPLVVLATAHPAKFPDAVKAACGVHPPLPAHMVDIFEKKERMESLRNDVHTVKKYIEDHA